MSWEREDAEAERLRAFLKLIAQGKDDPVQLALDALDGNEPPLYSAIIMVDANDEHSP